MKAYMQSCRFSMQTSILGKMQKMCSKVDSVEILEDVENAENAKNGILDLR